MYPMFHQKVLKNEVILFHDNQSDRVYKMRKKLQLNVFLTKLFIFNSVSEFLFLAQVFSFINFPIIFPSDGRDPLAKNH